MPISTLTVSKLLTARKGINPSVVWLPAANYAFLIDFLCDRFEAQGRDIWLARMQIGDVLDANGDALGPDARYERGKQVFYFREPEHEPPIPFDYHVLYQDEYLLVVDKPHFLPVIPTGRYARETLIARVRHDFNEPGLQLIHRLDRDTAGVIVLSRRPEDRGAYHLLFQNRVVQKTYEAIAPIPAGFDFPLVRRTRIVEAKRFFLSEEVPGVPNTETIIELLDQRGTRGYFGLKPVSGKKHQLRVHMNALGSPIENDALYPVALPAGEEDYARPLQLLARSIRFVDPITGGLREFVSRLQLNW